MNLSNENSAEKLHIQTIAVHTGYNSNSLDGDIMQPIHLATTFKRKVDGTMNDYSYTRSNNPNREAVEKKIAAIEGGSEAFAFSSGMAAINALFENILEPGAHIIIPDDCYHGTRNLLDKFFIRWKVDFSEVDMTDTKNVADAIKSTTRLIWMETPSNPQLKIVDIEAMTSIARQNKITIACDNTFATPLLQHPLLMGVDFVMHSSTKFFSGHSDVLGGVIIVKENTAISERLREYQQIAGAVPSPFDCWLLNRSLATFPIRIPLQCNNAMALAKHFISHPKIEKVFYPGLPGHINHKIAVKQMQGGFGSILSILVKGGKQEAINFAGKLRIFKHATSLGGVESLVEHRRSAEGAHPLSPDNLLRISVGIEYIDDLVNDINQALE
ncbi:MAG: aminotransferase class I/II-fold pyridoxal phosphate-dependent enzyme [Ferruginibacter sp.]